ncbi:MAG TPA: hypothetical protein VND67_10600 [Acidimicrobiales bacterium]|nr:hypothetical protein [Acidimicrobiales bacterium]
MTALDRSSISGVGWTAVSVAVCRAIESARPHPWFRDPLAEHAAPLWRPAVEEDPEVWMSGAGWCARAETMAGASASYGRPLPITANATNSWRLVIATAGSPVGHRVQAPPIRCGAR